MEASWHFTAMAALYVVAGLAHWLFPKVYRGILPGWVPAKNALIWLSGVAEVALGLALFIPGLRQLALIGIILMLAAFMPVHIYMLLNASKFKRIPKGLLWARIPLQVLLAYWAYAYLDL